MFAFPRCCAYCLACLIVIFLVASVPWFFHYGFSRCFGCVSIHFVTLVLRSEFPTTAKIHTYTKIKNRVQYKMGYSK